MCIRDSCCTPSRIEAAIPFALSTEERSNCCFTRSSPNSSFLYPASTTPRDTRSKDAPGCKAPTAALPPGASLLLVCRGVVEAAYKKEEFGLERVKQQFERSSDENAKGMAAAILDGVQQFMRAAPAQNDFTALALVRAAKGQVAIGA